MTRGLTRREFLIAGAGTVAGVSVLGAGGWILDEEAGATPLDLDLFRRGWPRAFFFRQATDDALSGDYTYDEWEKRYLPLGGIMGKVLAEEHGYDIGAGPFFLRYKANNPGKAVFLHYNGKGRRPINGATTAFSAGHWLYYKGTRLIRPVGSERYQNTLHVADTSVFSMQRYPGGLADDIVISAVDSRGRPNWNRAEHARLRGINTAAGTIEAKRGAYDTRPLSFPTGAYVAAHVAFGPYGDEPSDNLPLWSYNYSTAGPGDASGRTCREVLADLLVGKLGKGGELASFDGITFDVFGFSTVGRPSALEVDVNADNVADGGILGGVDTFGQGTLLFMRELRERLPGKIIMADGQNTANSQRNFGMLNGIETEGYPSFDDIALDNLSKGRNILNFWRQNSTAPSMNYVNYKYKVRVTGEPRNQFVEPDLTRDQSYRKLRVVLASALFADAFFTFAGGPADPRGDWTPPDTLWRKRNARVEVFDELWRGTDQRVGWLGLPLGPAVLLATEAPDLLDGRGNSWPQEFIDGFAGEGVTFARRASPPGLVVAAAASDPDTPSLKRKMVFELPGIEAPDADLFVSLRLRADPPERYSATVARRVDVKAGPDATGKQLTSFTWANGRPFSAMFYFGAMQPGPVGLTFQVEGDRPVYFESLTIHPAADAVYREYDNGAVFANFSARPYTFDLERLLPDVLFRRLTGSAEQDPVTNNGRPLGATLTLESRDALLVAKIAAP